MERNSHSSYYVWYDQKRMIPKVAMVVVVVLTVVLSGSNVVVVAKDVFVI